MFLKYTLIYSTYFLLSTQNLKTLPLSVEMIYAGSI